MKTFCIIRRLAIPLLSGFLVACSLTAPRDVGKANMFTLSAPEHVQVFPRRNGILQVNYPSVPSELDTYRIAVATADGRQDYFARTRWSEFLPSLVQAALQDTLTRSQLFSYVDTDEGKSRETYVLTTEIQEFQAAYQSAGAPPLVTIRMVFRLSVANTGRVVKQFSTRHTAVASANQLPAIAAAFAKAFADSQTEVVQTLGAR